MNPEINIVAAEYLGRYQLRLTFDDGSLQKVDFQPFLAASLHPQIRGFLDLEKFMVFRLEYGDLVWGDYELCFPISDLYDNQILSRHSERIAA
jgi:hypothetical protein